MKSKRKTKFYQNRNFYLVLMVLAILFMSIGYSTVNSVTVDLSGEAKIKSSPGIYVYNAQIGQGTNGKNPNDSRITMLYNDVMKSVVVLGDNTTATLTMTITIYNTLSYDTIFTGITYSENFYSNNNITYDVNGISVGTILPANSNTSFTMVFRYTGNDISNNTLASYLKFNFEKFYTITYQNINTTNKNYPTYILESESSKTVTFTGDIPYDVEVTPSGAGSYNLSTHVLTLTNVHQNISINRFYSITYNLNGGTNAQNNPTKYLHGANVSILDASKTDYVFAGWYENSGYTGSAVVNTNGLNRNLTLYAKFLSGVVAITSVTLSDYSNLQNPVTPTFTDDSVSFDLNFNVQSNSNLDDDYYAEYDVTITNDTLEDYVFASSVFTPSVATSTNTDMDVEYIIDGIEAGDIIPSEDSATFKIRIVMYPKATGNYNVTGGTDIVVEEDGTQTGNLTASIPRNSQIDLRGSTVRDKVTVTVVNDYDESKTFTFTISNSNFKLVDSNGTAIGNFTISASTTDTYDIYIERKSGVTFATTQQSVNMVFSTGSGNASLGNVKILVDQDTTLLDDEAPIISGVSVSVSNTNGNATISWSATDVSSIDYFLIDAYDTSDQLAYSYQTSNDNTSYTATGIAEGTYYFKVYGVDTKGNNGKLQATTCSTSASGYCSRSSDTLCKWVFSVTYSLGNNVTKRSGNDTVNRGNTLSASFSASGLGASLNTPTITMGGNQLSSSSYTWSSGNLSVPNVTGDLVINVTASCLIEGTKVLLANGKYKKIEDVTYNDLLYVWNYETGSMVKEYPIWIEKKNSTSFYQKTTFSDGTVLKTLGYHGVFSPTYNEFISVDDVERFKVGTKITKVEKEKLKEVTIKKIEFVNEKVNYYHVVSSRYYNIIANDILTTDGTVILSNLYGFGKNITWNNNVRNSIMSDKNNLYSYNEFSDIMPYYMFKALRVEEGKFLSKYGLTKELFRYYLINNQLNEDMLLDVPTNSNGKRIWMVTTDYDNVKNINNYLYEEGSYYRLPNLFGVKAWYSTSENKYYTPNELVRVNHSLHFMPIKY